MQITLDLPGPIADILQVQAAREGLSLDQFLMQAAVQKAGAFGLPSFDPYLAAAGENARQAADEAVRLGVTDRFGQRMRSELPEDMREGADRDFGG